MVFPLGMFGVFFYTCSFHALSLGPLSRRLLTFLWRRNEIQFIMNRDVVECFYSSCLCCWGFGRKAELFMSFCCLEKRTAGSTREGKVVPVSLRVIWLSLPVDLLYFSCCKQSESESRINELNSSRRQWLSVSGQHRLITVHSKR